MWQAIAAGVAVGSSILGGMSANKAAKDAAKEQAQLTYRQRQEEIRQRTLAARQEKGLAKASVYASNLQMGGSSKKYVEALDMENMREIAFARNAAEKERQAILAGAQGAGNSLFYQAAGDALGFAANQLGTYYSTRTPASSSGPVNSQATNQAGGFYGTGLE